MKSAISKTAPSLSLAHLWIEPKGRTLTLPTFTPPLKLAVVMLTDPASSFRGKCYADFIQALCGRDLYKTQNNKTVLKIAHALERFVARIDQRDVQSTTFSYFDMQVGHIVQYNAPAIGGIKLQDIKDLTRMLRRRHETEFKAPPLGKIFLPAETLRALPLSGLLQPIIAFV